MPETTARTASAAVPTEPDPYALRAEDVRKAPTTFTGRLRHLGPGFVLSAAVVGSGELIVTTSLGARAGFVLLWLVVISTGVKVWVQMELARWTILNGRTALEGYREVGPRIGPVSWINWLWIGMDFAKMFQRGGIIGGTAAACSVMWPVTGEALSYRSLAVWTFFVTALAVVLLRTGKYNVVEQLCVASVVIFTVATVALALGLPLTEFRYGTGELGEGFSFLIPAGTAGVALAMFGITGVGADEMTTYTYWCIEKGYARWTGPDDGTEERARRAEGWLKVMRLDVAAGWLVCTLCTLSFYVIGAAVLHPQKLVPEGNSMITTLSRIYTDTMGPWAEYLFLIGAFTVLFSTLVGSTASVPRLWSQHARASRSDRLARRPRTAAHDPDPDLVPAGGVGVVLPVRAVAGADGADRWHRRRCLPPRRGDRGLAPSVHRRREALPGQPMADRGTRRQQRGDRVPRCLRRPGRLRHQPHGILSRPLPYGARGRSGGRSSRWPPPTSGRRMDWSVRGGRAPRQVAGER
ncbi:Nramp family divalent metal transporter [Streptomyces sp. GLT-R25]